MEVPKSGEDRTGRVEAAEVPRDLPKRATI